MVAAFFECHWLSYAYILIAGDGMEAIINFIKGIYLFAMH